jgi:murein DD-endopeptidase MepM/ murein hydrolase activator NlpD
MISKETRDKINKAKDDLKTGLEKMAEKVNKFKDKMQRPEGLDLSPSGLIQAERAMEQLKMLQSKILSGGINLGSTLFLKNYVLTFSYVTEPALRTMSSSMGGYFDILANAVAEEERMRQKYRVIALQNVLSIGQIGASHLLFGASRTVAGAAVSVPQSWKAITLIRQASSSFFSVLKTTGSVAQAAASVRLILTGAMAGITLLGVGASLGAFVVGLIPMLIGLGFIYLTSVAVEQFLDRTELGGRIKEQGLAAFGNFQDYLLTLRPQVYENYVALYGQLQYAMSNEGRDEIRDELRESLGFLGFLAPYIAPIAQGQAMRGFSSGLEGQSITLAVIDALAGNNPLLEEELQRARNRALMEMFKPDPALTVYRNNAFLLGTEIARNGVRGDGLELLVGNEFGDFLRTGEDPGTRSLTSRVYEDAYTQESSRIFGNVDLRAFGIGTQQILSIAKNLELGTQTGYNEEVVSTIATMSALYTGGQTAKMEQIMQNIIRANAFDDTDVNQATEKFEEFFAAAVGDGKPQAAHLKIVSSLSEFTRSYAAATKMNLGASSEIAKIHQFLTTDGTVNDRFSADPTKTLIKTMDNLLLQGATYSNLGATQVFNALGITREEAVKGVTSDADIFERFISGVIDFMGVNSEDIKNNSATFDLALQNFSLMTGMSGSSLNPLLVAIKKYAEGERIENIKEEYYQNSLTSADKVINSVKSSIETASGIFDIQKNITDSANKLIHTVNLNLGIISTVQGLITNLVLDDGIFEKYSQAAITIFTTMTDALKLIPEPPESPDGSSRRGGPLDWVFRLFGVAQASPLIGGAYDNTPRSVLIPTPEPRLFPAAQQNLANLYSLVYESLGEEGRGNFTQEFFNELVNVSQKTNMPIEHLIAIMNFETMGTFSPTIRPTRRDGTLISSAVGLIQFMSATAGGLGTSTEELLGMTAVEQLRYVEEYFMRYSNKITPGMSLTDAYLLVFRPASSGMDPHETVFSEGSAGYLANIGLDLNKDGKITVEEIGKRIQTHTDRNIPGLTTFTARTQFAGANPSINYNDIGNLIYLDAERVSVTAGWGATDSNYHRTGHRGIDFVGLGGEGSKNIYSPVSGIATVQRSPELGLTVIVKDARGAYHVFAHLSQALISPGDVVSQGTQLGIEGMTGIGTGSHLHYDVRIPGQNYDPTLFDRTYTLNYNTVRQINPLDYFSDYGNSFREPFAPFSSTPNQRSSNSQSQDNSPKAMHISIPLASRNPHASAQTFSNYMSSYLGT